MGYPFPPDLDRIIQARMAAGGYNSEDELLADAMQALADVECRRAELQAETRRRVAKSGSSLSQPLDRTAFKEEARRRRSQTE